MTARADYDFMADSYGCWELATAVRRERLVRLGIVKPISADERRQAAEGRRPEKEYDAVREAGNG